MRGLIGSLALVAAAAAGAMAEPPATEPVEAAAMRSPELTGAEIVARAHAAAGGETWVRPRTLVMTGYGIFFRNGVPSVHERHAMWRVYPEVKDDAHAADGKVRIDSLKDGAPVFQVSFDGETTYDQNGPIEAAADSDAWKASFGYGAIRFALDEGYSVRREADDLVDGRPAYHVMVVDPSGGETLFATAMDDHAILKVGFDTPRGWHERIYSDFFTKPGVDWVQPGRVRLFYNGVKANEVVWTDFEVNAPIADEMFALPARAGGTE